MRIGRTTTNIYLVLCLIVSASLYACQGGAGDFSSIRNLASRGTNIICFGDSLTEGVGAKNGNSYPDLLSAGLGIPVINAGHRGDTAPAALQRLHEDVLDRDPRLVIVLLGGNDFLRRVPLEVTRGSLEEIIRRIQERGAMVALVGLKLGLFRDEYGPLFEKMARSHGALLVPEILDGILSDPSLKSDQIHPNGAGYALIAARILDRVKPLLRAADLKRG
ncbi:MAG TPA: GDSL-type esterase/lipase family protein [Candidatus Binatia bacterium]